ncbi:MAG: glycerophosphodiester phosphodiesterase family protein [Pontixanthobacter sp.]
MKKVLIWVGYGLAIAFVALTVINASWLAETPRGKVKLISHGGAAQYYERTALGPDDCSAGRIEPVSHPYIANTMGGATRAAEFAVRYVALDVRRTADGDLVAFGDDTLDCLTDGSGSVSDKTAAELRTLDAGYRYSADGGQTFPLRGRANSDRVIRPIGEIAKNHGDHRALIYRFGENDAALADLLVAKLTRAGRDPANSRDAFIGPAAPVARMRELAPDAWSFDPESARRCAADYVMTGWYGSVPESCHQGTMLIPVDEQWKFWGWPDRLIARVSEYGTRIIVTGSTNDRDIMSGLTRPEQLGDIPATFNGHIWVDDTWTVAPALRPDRDGRRDDQKEAAALALQKRRDD